MRDAGVAGESLAGAVTPTLDGPSETDAAACCGLTATAVPATCCVAIVDCCCC